MPFLLIVFKIFTRAALRTGGRAKTNSYQFAGPLCGMPMFQWHDFFAGHWPVKEFGMTQMDCTRVKLPVTEAILSTCMRFPVNEAMDKDYIRAVAKAVRKVAKRYAV